MRRGWSTATIAVVVACALVSCSDADDDADPTSTTAEPAEVVCGPTDLIDDVGDSTPQWVAECQKLNVTASYSAHDLTGDGVVDPIVNLVDGDEPYRVVALDGASGEQLWVTRDGVTMIALAQFADLNGDDVPDVVVGGRGVPVDERPLVAFDGRDGSTLWRVEPIDPTWRNVYTPQPVDDRDGDGVDDWVVATGGDWLRTPDQPVTVPGRLVLVGGADGSVLAQIDLPDMQETYNSPVLVREDGSGEDGSGEDGGDEQIVIGSGGELLPGALWRLPVDAIESGDLDAFVRLVDGDGVSSFIAPVSVGDLDGDGRTDAVALRMDGQLSAFDPITGTMTWTSSAVDGVGVLPADAALSSLAVPAIGQLDDDPALEVVTLHTLVTAEQLESGDVYGGDSVLVVHDGATGAIEHRLDGPTVGAVVSPLIASSGGVPGVVCSCAPPLDPASTGAELTGAVDLGWWQPGTPPVSLGVLATETMTPLLSVTDDGTVHLLSGAPYMIRGAEHSVVSVVVPRAGQHTIDGVEWGGYMGLDASGRAGPVRGRG